MRKMCLSLITVLVFFVAGALAQTSTPGSSTPDQGTTSASPSSQSPDSTQQQRPMSETPSAGNSQESGYGHSKGDTGMKGEKKMKGCIRSENGQYTLEEKSGKSVPLSGQDVSAHVGHEVVVHGTWGGSSGSMAGSSSTAGGSSSTSGGSMANAFNVTSVDMVSETCGKTKNSMK